MLNFRQLRKDYSPAILKEGRSLFDTGMVQMAKITRLKPSEVRISSRIKGQFEHTYTCEIEIDRSESCVIDADCDCPYKYDCNHLAALLHYLEEHLDEMVVSFSKEGKKSPAKKKDVEEEDLEEIVRQAEKKQVVKKGKKQQKELVGEYRTAAKILGCSPFFLSEQQPELDQAELAVICDFQKRVEIQLALRVPYRSKPLHVMNTKEFFDAVHYEESIWLGNKRLFLGQKSFDAESRIILESLLESARFQEGKGDRQYRIFYVDYEAFGMLLAKAFAVATERPSSRGVIKTVEEGLDPLPCLYFRSLEEPMRYSTIPAKFRFDLEALDVNPPKILLKPGVMIETGRYVDPAEVSFFECSKPGLIHQQVYCRFAEGIRRKHLQNLHEVGAMAIPQPLFGTLIENSLSELMRYAEVEVDKEATGAGRNKAIRNVAKSVSLPGFRKGKAPSSIIKERYPKEIEQEFRQMMLRTVFKEVLQLTGIRPYQPEEKLGLSVKKFEEMEEGKTQLCFEVETQPEPPSVDLEQLTLPGVPVDEVNQEDVEDALRQLQLRSAEWSEVTERAVEKEDFPTVSIVLTEEPNEQVCKDARIDMGSHSIKPWVKEALLGMEINTPKEVNPKEIDPSLEASEKEPWAEKTHRIEVTQIESTELTEVSEEFAKKIGADSVNDLREKVKAQIEKKRQENAQGYKRNLIAQKLLNHNIFEIPRTLSSYLLDAARNMVKDSQQSEEQITSYLLEDAKLSLLIGKVAADHTLSLSEEEISAGTLRLTMQQIMQNPQGYSEETMKRMREQAPRQLLREKVLDFLIEKAPVTEGEKA